ncbi:MAG: conjugal transfer protein TraG N-terminal domain-containing protein [Syntrophorhabdaceae bacterium]|nr:conjugal transfer protein TraG N-terminal domain-containing protein [Syntrophorhabdaceae bacterium]
MRKLILIAIVVPVTIVFFAGEVLALDMEYYTYNGFDSIVGAFQKVALIFGDNGYKALFFSVIALGFLFGAMGMVMKAIGGRYSPAAWAAPIGIGIIIYLALIIPKGTLHIYDPIKNRTQAVGNLPDGVIAVAGLLNLVERGLVDIVSTSGTPEGYQAQAGGVGFDMIFNLGSKGVVLADKNINASLQRYTEDCLLFEFLRPGTALTINGAMNNTDFVSIYEEAAAPAIYTVYYSAGGDNTATCQEAWTNIKADISNINTFGDSIKSQCADSGFDPTNPLELQQCRDTLTNLLNWLQGASYDTLRVYQQTLLAQSLNDALLSVSPDTATTVIASRNTGTAMLSSGMFANSWIPAIRAVITAIAIGLIPFMVIFIPTPLVNRAVGILVGFFIWITAWGVTDAVVHQFAMDYAKKAFDEVTRNQLGLTAIMNFSTSGMKTLAAFASIRWSGIMLATVITGMLVRFGGHALAQLSGQITSLPQRQAQSAAMSAMTPEGMSRSLGAAEMAPAAMANAHKFSFMDRSASHTMDRLAKTHYGRDMASTFGGTGGASEMKAAAAVGRDIGFGARGAAMRDGAGGYQGAYSRSNFMARTGERESGNLQTTYGNDSAAFGDRRSAAEETFAGMAREGGMSPGEMQAAFSTMDYGGTMQFAVKYGGKRGIGLQDAARELGEISGSQRYTGAAGYDNARGIVGDDGMVFTQSNKHLNEVAKFESAYQLAHGLGLAQDKEDFAGMYAHHRMHHGEDSLTLTSQAAVDRLNQRMGSMGYSTRFSVGDRVRMNFDEDGNILSAYGTRGASHDSQDITRELRGYHFQHLNLTESRTGYRGEHGYADTTYNFKRTQGVEWKPVGEDKNGNPVHGWVVNDAYFNKDSGQLVSQTWTNQNTGHTTGVQWVDTGKTDANGNPITQPQFFSGTTEFDSKGRTVLSNMSSISSSEFDKNGYHTVQKVSGSTGQTLHETNRQGQDTARVDKLVIDNQSEFRGTAGNILMHGDDKTTVDSTKVGVMIGTSMVEKGTGMFTRTSQFQDVFKGPGGGGSSAGSPDLGMKDYQEYLDKARRIQSQKMNHQLGDYASPGSAKTIRPRSVNID